MPLVKNPNDIRLAMVGMVEGNGHPYSWSAIFNGYDRNRMAGCPYPGIPDYLGREPNSSFGIPGARVTHIWCDREDEARDVAAASNIPTVVGSPEDVIGEVNAVVIPTDKGEEHWNRSRPFLDVGLPVFIDKPLTTVREDLRRFVEARANGSDILSTSCMRYAKEYAAVRKGIEEGEIGEPRLITMTTAKSWERYGIHALEGVYPFLEPGGWTDVVNTGTADSNVVHVRHECGVEVALAAIADLYGAFGHLNVYGTKGSLSARFGDTFNAFKTQLEVFVEYLRTGVDPFPFEETTELMNVVIAGIESRERGGVRVSLTETEV